jgi:hypothetical protein
MQLASRTTVCLGMMLLLFSCTCGGVPNSFFLLPNEQRDAEFQKYDLETQYKIYICGQKREPPMFGLASPLAREGGRIVPLLKMKLEGTDNDLRIRDIVRLFREMNDLGTYNVAGDKSLMEELQSKVGEMKDPDWRKVTEKMLIEIREKPPETSKP